VGLSVLHGKGSTTSITRAARTIARGATELGFFSAARLLARQLALGLRAQGRCLALPCALGLLAQRRAVGFGGSAGSTAHSRAAYGFAFGTAFELAHLLGTTDGTHGLFAVDFAFGTFGLLAVHLAFGTGADRVALGRAHRIVTQPLALRMALCLDCQFRGGSKSDKARQEGNLSHCNLKY